MTVQTKREMPALFHRMMELGCLSETEVCSTGDGLFAATRSVADMLACRGITTIPSEREGCLECSLFFDDWFLFSVPHGEETVYSLFKMREQEHDAEQGLYADGDNPGVTVPFVALQTGILTACLEDPTPENRVAINEEINRVVAYRGQRHHEGLKAYFIRTEAQGPYLMAKLYAEQMASFAEEGVLPVPERYAADCEKGGGGQRLPRFIEENNRAAGAAVCDHKNIYIRDPKALSKWERLAILATHTGNVSVYSFAAEVQFHAKFLTGWARIPIPGIGRSAYDSAIRADMSIADAEFTGPTPYYDLNSRSVRAQQACHGERVDRQGY